jgi:hypothetical protein
MDFESFRYPAVALFSSAMMLEATLTAKLFFERKSIKVSSFMRWWAVFALFLMSMANCYAGLEVYSSPFLGAALVTKAIYCISGLVLLSWVYFFHLDKWKSK